MEAIKLRPVWTYLALPAVLSVAAVIWAGWTVGAAMALSVALLIILEISLSLDNAVVNAHVLEHWNPFWRKLFLGVGIIVAVFGMRLVFPVLIVSVATGLGWGETVNMALKDPAEYGRRLHDVHHLVGAFGGAFLLMVGLAYFLDGDKDNHWLPGEWILTKAGQIEAVQAAVVLTTLLVTSHFIAPELQQGFVFAGVLGVLTFIGSKALGTLATGGQEVGSKIVRGSVGGFLYLELLDASFSFDGVIGAFAITSNLLWITVGLGIGALAVRELTILAVDRGTLTEFPYLEHGAFWAIIALGAIMVISPLVAVPEVVTGLIGAVLIGAAFISSILANRKAVAATVSH